MKNSSWYLWLNGKKVSNIRELRENFDTAALIGYFLGGSLHGWLSDIGENVILDRLASIDTNGDIGRQLEFAFGVVPTKKDLTELTELPASPTAPEVIIPAKKAVEAGITEAAVYTAVSSFGAVSSFESYLPSFTAEETTSAYGIGSYQAFLIGQAVSSGISFASSFGGLLGSFTQGLLGSFAQGGFGFGGTSSFYSGSFGSLGSFGLSALFGYTTSFSASSFSVGSYLSMYGLYGLLGKFGSFSGYGSYKGIFVGSFAWGTYTLGSFRFGISGSFGGLGSFLNLGGLLSSGFMGSYGSFGSIDRFFAENGSFRNNETGVTISADEYRRTLINLSSCPLNAYGYGINLI